MLPIPDGILKPFDEIMEKNGISTASRVDCRKWLMYYLDFRVKYPPPDSRSEQVLLFMEKLRVKGPIAKEAEAGRRCPVALFRHATAKGPGRCFINNDFLGSL